MVRDRVFRDPVHGLIEFRDDDAPLSAILDTRPMQRLRRIRQMGLAWLVYAGAEHSRFGHALGAFHVAGRIAHQLDIPTGVARHLRIAALVHDIGHGPLSHTWEQVFNCDHEAWGARIITEDPELRAVLESLEPELPQTLCGFWDKSYRPAFARKIVSSQLDADRLDYLLRDAHYSGARYATYDLEWIMHALRCESVRDNPADPIDVVVDYRRGMYAVEQYLFARTYMYAQVYHHKTVRAAEWMFLKLLGRFAELARTGREPPALAAAGRLARGETLSVADYLWLDDVSLFSAIDTWAGRGPDGDRGAAHDPIVRDLAGRLVDRRLFKTIELGEDQAIIAEVEPAARAVARKRFGADADYYFHVDTAQQVAYSTNAEAIHVVGHPRSAGDHKGATLGELLADLPLGRPVSSVRLVCAPELVHELTPVASAVLAAPVPAPSPEPSRG